MPPVASTSNTMKKMRNAFLRPFVFETLAGFTSSFLFSVTASLMAEFLPRAKVPSPSDPSHVPATAAPGSWRTGSIYSRSPRPPPAAAPAPLPSVVATPAENRSRACIKVSAASALLLSATFVSPSAVSSSISALRTPCSTLPRCSASSARRWCSVVSAWSISAPVRPPCQMGTVTVAVAVNTP